MYIRKATRADFNTALHLIDEGRNIMMANGNPTQWPAGYPAPACLLHDIEQGNLYLVMNDEQAVGTFALLAGPDVTYAHINGQWTSEPMPYHVIHRMASLPNVHGIFDAIMHYCAQRCTYLRIDTHRSNRIMRHCLAKHGFTYCGTILASNQTERLAYDKLW